MTTRPKRAIILKAGLSAGLTLSVAACGVRGPLEPPVDQTVVEGEADTTTKTEEIHRGFILDGLLN